MSVSVLLVDDDEDDFVITRSMLAEVPGAEYTLHWARSVVSGLELWRSGEFDVVLLDYRLGPRTGLELLKTIRESGSQVPIIVLTGQREQSIDIESLAAGATDYLVKGDFSAALLDRAIRYSLAITAMNRRLLDEHKQLIQAERLSSVGLLAASVAHEVNNPLGGVMSLVRALRDNAVSEEKRAEYFDAIEDGLGRMRTTIRGLLDFSREQPPRMEPVPLAEMAIDCLRLLAATLRSKGIVSDVSVCEQHSARGDRSRLMQALLNLLMNASDATPRGGTINVSCESDANKVALVVTDSGSGIPQEIAQRVVEPFFTTKPSGHGTGLGLAIVQTIVKEHGGTMEIRSAPGQGTTIKLWLEDLAKSDGLSCSTRKSAAQGA
jgi:signal transduction histidine kinase